MTLWKQLLAIIVFGSAVGFIIGDLAWAFELPSILYGSITLIALVLFTQFGVITPLDYIMKSTEKEVD